MAKVNLEIGQSNPTTYFISLFIKLTLQPVTIILLMKKLFFLIPLLIVFLMTSCSIQKRHYMNGYSIQWNKKINANKNTAPEKETTDNEKNISNDISASAGNDITPIIIEKPSPLISIEKPVAVSDSCDVIRLKDKSVIHGKVTEINNSSVKYKDCDDVREVIRTISKDKIAGITYSNGKEENPEVLKSYKEPEPDDYRLKDSNKMVKHSETENIAKSSRNFGLAALGFILAALLFILLGAFALLTVGVGGAALIILGSALYIAAIVLSIMAITRAVRTFRYIRDNPRDVIYRHYAITGLVLGIIILGLFVIIPFIASL